MRFVMTSFGFIASMYCSNPIFSKISSALRSYACFDDCSCESDTRSFHSIHWLYYRERFTCVYVCCLIYLPSFSAQILLSKFESIILCPPFDVMLFLCWSFGSITTEPRFSNEPPLVEAAVAESAPVTDIDDFRDPFWVYVYFLKWMRLVIHSLRSYYEDARNLKFFVV